MMLYVVLCNTLHCCTKILARKESTIRYNLLRTQHFIKCVVRLWYRTVVSILRTLIKVLNTVVRFWSTVPYSISAHTTPVISIRSFKKIYRFVQVVWFLFFCFDNVINYDKLIINGIFALCTCKYVQYIQYAIYTGTRTTELTYSTTMTYLRGWGGIWSYNKSTKVLFWSDTSPNKKKPFSGN